MATIEEWRSFAERLYAKAVDIFDGADVVETEAGTAEPNVVALTLLARTINNFEAANILLTPSVSLRPVQLCGVAMKISSGLPHLQGRVVSLLPR